MYSYLAQMQNQSAQWRNAFGTHETPDSAQYAAIKGDAWRNAQKPKEPMRGDSEGMAWLRVRVDEIRAVGRRVMV